MQTTFTNSLWSASATPAPDCPRLEQPAECDVVIIGAGYTGLSAALHLAAAGQSVVVLEAAEPGFGCSGRNGGQVNPASTRMLPDEVLNELGPAWGEKYLRFGDRSTRIVFELIDRYNIQCEAVQPGYVQGGYGNRGQRVSEQWASQWGRRGIDIELLNREQVEQRIGTRCYQSGFVDPRGGNVQPLSYARGLARAAQQHGAQVHGQSAAESIKRHGSQWVVSATSGATVTARRVVIATNGYTDELWPGLRESIVPTASYLSATEPLDEQTLAKVLPGRHAVSESARVLVYYRRDDAGRFILGAHGNLSNTSEFGRTDHVRREAVRLFPVLAGVKWTHHWAGWPAITPNHFPHLFELDDGVYAGLGYNGRGVASATLMGSQIADLLLDRAEPLIQVRPLRKFAFHAFRQVGISYHLLSRKALDRLDRS